MVGSDLPTEDRILARARPAAPVAVSSGSRSRKLRGCPPDQVWVAHLALPLAASPTTTNGAHTAEWAKYTLSVGAVGAFRPRRRRQRALSHGEKRSARHDEMAHAVVAVDERHSVPLPQHPDGGIEVESTGTNAPRDRSRPRSSPPPRSGNGPRAGWRTANDSRRSRLSACTAATRLCHSPRRHRPPGRPAPQASADRTSPPRPDSCRRA